jgi:membrane associated rhomboid family serine protease
MQAPVRTVKAVGTPVVTYSVIGVAGVLFVACVLSHDNAALAGVWRFIRTNLYPGPGIWDGEVWRLLSGAFLHWSGGGLIMNVLHVGFNCWWVLELGRAMEHGFGRVALALFVLGSAMVGTGLEWMMSGPAVGLSGVVFGLALFLFVHRRTNPFAAAVMNRRTLQVLGFWFLLCIYLTTTGALSVANWGHAAGAAFGFGVGHAALHKRRKLLLPAAALGTALFVYLCTQVAFGDQAKRRHWHLATRDFRRESGRIEAPDPDVYRVAGRKISERRISRMTTAGLQADGGQAVTSVTGR